MATKLMKFNEVPIGAYFICGGKLYRKIDPVFPVNQLSTTIFSLNAIDVDESKLECFCPDGKFEINIQE